MLVLNGCPCCVAERSGIRKPAVRRSSSAARLRRARETRRREESQQRRHKPASADRQTDSHSYQPGQPASQPAMRLSAHSLIRTLASHSLIRAVRVLPIRLTRLPLTSTRPVAGSRHSSRPDGRTKQSAVPAAASAAMHHPPLRRPSLPEWCTLASVCSQSCLCPAALSARWLRRASLGSRTYSAPPSRTHWLAETYWALQGPVRERRSLSSYRRSRLSGGADGGRSAPPHSTADTLTHSLTRPRRATKQALRSLSLLAVGCFVLCVRTVALTVSVLSSSLPPASWRCRSSTCCVRSACITS